MVMLALFMCKGKFLKGPFFEGWCHLYSWFQNGGGCLSIPVGGIWPMDNCQSEERKAKLGGNTKEI